MSRNPRRLLRAETVLSSDMDAGVAREPKPRCARKELVEPDGIEPTTSCLQSTRSPS
jgi:hypothetical protein